MATGDSGHLIKLVQMVKEEEQGNVTLHRLLLVKIHVLGMKKVLCHVSYLIVCIFQILYHSLYNWFTMLSGLVIWDCVQTMANHAFPLVRHYL